MAALVALGLALFVTHPLIGALWRGRAAAKRVSECVEWSAFEDEYKNEV